MGKKNPIKQIETGVKSTIKTVNRDIASTTRSVDKEVNRWVNDIAAEANRFWSNIESALGGGGSSSPAAPTPEPVAQVVTEEEDPLQKALRMARVNQSQVNYGNNIGYTDPQGRTRVIEQSLGTSSTSGLGY